VALDARASAAYIGIARREAAFISLASEELFR